VLPQRKHPHRERDDDEEALDEAFEVEADEADFMYRREDEVEGGVEED
jgi:hypothetical protein